MDVGTAIVTSVVGGSAVLGFFVTLWKFLGKKNNASTPITNKDWQTNKDVNTTITDRLKQFEGGVCKSFREKIEGEVKMKTESLENKIDGQKLDMKDRIETMEKNIHDKMDTQYVFMSEKFKDILTEIKNGRR